MGLRWRWTRRGRRVRGGPRPVVVRPHERKEIMNALTNRRTAAFAAVLLTLMSGAAGAQQLPTVTMPLKDDKADHWEFFGDRLMGVDVDRGVLKLSARVNTYSLAEGKHLWRQEFDMGYKMNEVAG